jgi:Phage integrase family
MNHVTFHTLRHFAATTLAGQGIGVRTIAGRLGHANPSVTLRTYAYFLEAADRDDADAIGSLVAALKRPLRKGRANSALLLRLAIAIELNGRLLTCNYSTSTSGTEPTNIPDQVGQSHDAHDVGLDRGLGEEEHLCVPSPEQEDCNQQAEHHPSEQYHQPPPGGQAVAVGDTLGEAHPSRAGKELTDILPPVTQRIAK